MNDHTVHLGPIFKGINNIVGRDDLRPTMQNAVIDKGFIVATDGHQLIKIDLNVFGLDYKSIQILEQSALDRDLLTKLGALKKSESWFITEAGFNIIKSNGKVGIIYPLGSKDDEGNYPQYEAVIPTTPIHLDQISLNPQYLLNVEKIYDAAKGDSTEDLRLNFHGSTRGCTITNYERTFLGLVMPRKMYDHS